MKVSILFFFNLVSFLSAHQFNTNATISWSFYEEEVKKENENNNVLSVLFELEKKFQWGQVTVRDISITHKLSLSEAFHGTMVTFPIERVMINYDCDLVVCNECNGTGHIVVTNSEHHHHHHHSSITMPCPRCTGTGVCTKDECMPFNKHRFDIPVTFPQGTRPGDVITIKGMGNQGIKLSQVRERGSETETRERER